MHRPEEIMNLLFEVFDQLDLQLQRQDRLEKSPDTVLFGPGVSLDSLWLVNLIVLVEERIYDRFGQSLTLVDERALSQATSPFHTVKSLCDYINVLMTEAAMRQGN